MWVSKKNDVYFRVQEWKNIKIIQYKKFFLDTFVRHWNSRVATMHRGLEARK